MATSGITRSFECAEPRASEEMSLGRTLTARGFGKEADQEAGAIPFRRRRSFRL